MKSVTFPPLRATPELRRAAEEVLEEGESLSRFVETSVRQQIEARRNQKEFIARGLAARDEARRTGVYYDKDDVMNSLQSILDDARAHKQP